MTSKTKRESLSPGEGLRKVTPAFHLLFTLLFLLPCTLAAETSISVNSRTYLQVRETLDSDTIIPLYEYLDAHIDDVGLDDVSFHFGGWGRVDLGDENPINGERTNGDLQYAYFSYRGGKGNPVINLGRTLVYEGVASERIDGIYGRVDLLYDITVAAYAGVPVETDFDDAGGDYIVGGRMSHSTTGLYTSGVSYLYESNDGSDFRQEAGIDIWIKPVKWASLYGKSSYNIRTSGWMEHGYTLDLGPFHKLKFLAELSYVNYEDFFTEATTSAFELIPSIINPDEKVLSLGGVVEYPILDNLTVSGDYKNYDYELAGGADYYGGACKWTIPGSAGAGASAHRMDGESESLQYVEFRAYGYKKFGKYDIFLDFINVNYDREINNESNAYTGSLAVGYNLWKNARVAANVDYSHNPDFDSDVRFFIKVLYGFQKTLSAKGGE